jgi:hypothetical protein
MGMAGPLLFGLLGTQVASGGVSVATPPSLLVSHRNTIQQ